tara:strand:- start:247 stop:417 length:171 start_codon:yes stop_codon:yes gene_type:complete
MKDNTEDEDEYELSFEPDDALILALNEINDLKELIETQNSAIEDLKEDILKLKKKK